MPSIFFTLRPAIGDCEHLSSYTVFHAETQICFRGRSQGELMASIDQLLFIRGRTSLRESSATGIHGLFIGSNSYRAVGWVIFSDLIQSRQRMSAWLPKAQARESETNIGNHAVDINEHRTARSAACEVRSWQRTRCSKARQGHIRSGNSLYTSSLFLFLSSQQQFSISKQLYQSILTIFRYPSYYIRYTSSEWFSAN